ncbi:MAG: chromosomal replication initiator protein DnaA [Treponema sp.]
MSQFNYEPFWKDTLKRLKNETEGFELAYLDSLEYRDSKENCLILVTPSFFHREQILQKYLNQIEKSLFSLSNTHITLQIDVDPNMDKDENNNVEHEVDQNEEIQEVKNENQNNDLNEKYTFENFIIGPSNNYAANAAIAVANNPGKTPYNPLLIYGGVGLGKTHLLQAIGNRVHKQTKLKILYVSAETFMTDFIQSVNNNSNKLIAMESFKKKYRNIDVLLMDDIQYLQKGEQVKEEIFHTFNHLYQNKKQIVFTSDEHPSELKGFPERLKSRFKCGLITDINVPEYETRYAILMKKNEFSNIKLENDIIDLIAKNISSNVRELEATFYKAISYIEFIHNKLDLENAKKLLIDDFNSKKQLNITVELIQSVVAEYFNVSIDDIKSKKKTKKIVCARQYAMFLAREMTEYSTTELGADFGSKDHTTIIYAHQKISDQMLSEPSIQASIETLKKIIKEKSSK